MGLVKTGCFLLGTWGVILGIPTLGVLFARTWMPLWAALCVGLVLLLIGIVLGEWLARGMNWLLGSRGSPQD